MNLNSRVPIRSRRGKFSSNQIDPPNLHFFSRFFRNLFVPRPLLVQSVHRTLTYTLGFLHKITCSVTHRILISFLDVSWEICSSRDNFSRTLRPLSMSIKRGGKNRPEVRDFFDEILDFRGSIPNGGIIQSRTTILEVISTIKLRRNNSWDWRKEFQTGFRMRSTSKFVDLIRSNRGMTEFTRGRVKLSSSCGLSRNFHR